MKRLTLLLTCFFISMGLAIAQNVKVSGIVLDESGEPVSGASVIVKNNPSIGTVTNAEGQFNLEVPASAKVLVIKFLGMTDAEGTVSESMRITLKRSEELLDEVVVVAYGTRKRGSITGAVSTVGSKEVSKLPVGSFDQALQGTTSGVQVSTNTGRPGAASIIRIRGIGSINAGVAPLYIIDGIEGSASDFSAISSGDVESVSVLKDASATALYGSRAANGVILVTTKKGQTGTRATITYNGYYGISEKVKENFTLMNSNQKLDYEIALGLRDADDPDLPKLRAINTDWIDVLMGETAQTQSHELSVRGGSSTVRYFASGNFMNADGILINSDFKRYGMRLNLEADATKDLKIGTTMNVAQQYSKNTITADLGYTNNIYNPAFRALLENPYTQPYREDGSYTTQDDGLMGANPIEHLELDPTNYSNLRLMGTAWGELSFLKDFKAKTLLGIDYYDLVTDAYVSPNSAWGTNTGGTVTRGLTRTTRVTNTNTIQYKKTFENVHNVTVLLGEETYSLFSDVFSVRGKGLPNDKLSVLGVTSSYDGAPGTGSIKTDYSMASFFGSLNYNYDDKYFVDLSLRRDGCSKFGENNRWGTFGSIGAMWNLKREAFAEDIEILSDLRLRSSYGTMGNNDIGNYSWIATYGLSGTYNKSNAGFLSAPGNSDLTWEKIGMFDVGVNIGLQDKYNIELGYYNKTTSNMLFSVPYSYTTGFSSGWKNIGKMRNQGFESKITADIIKNNDWKWTIGGTFSYNKNEILELYGNVTEIPDAGSSTILKVGMPLGTRYVNRFAGVNPANGKTLWYDKDGNVTETYRASDAVAIKDKSWIPSYSGGFNTSVEYKGITLSADFTFMGDYWITNNARFFTESNGGFADYNQSVRMLDYWKQPGDITSVPHPKYAQNEFDDRVIEDATYLRFKSLMASYAFPSKLVKKTKIFQSARIYGQAYNLYTWTNYKGYDPEQYGNTELGGYPQIRSYVIGVEIGF